ncbi:elongation of very long chain fatty acids protein 7-like, partial [Physella acuta]|uniref:elongation of very long chain fatty acids protein 7-like n=1 Tax=Physella acuta TaxID=109671 RepID=UPI0027DC591A
RLSKTCWLFCISKYIEFLDTVFFILRKKHNQVTFLHVYHHTSMALITWIGLKFFSGGNNVAYGIVNSFVHVIMYSYYALSALGPEMRKYLWWKKYLTKLQIGQFVVLLIYAAWNEMFGCPFSRIFVNICIVYILTILLLFINFYIRAYLSSNRQAREDAAQKLRDEGENNTNGAVKKVN